MNDLISDILDFSKIEAGKIDLYLEETNPTAIFQESIPIFQEMLLKKNISFEGVQNSDKKILADQTRLRQIFLNFMSNAVKYNKPGGSIQFGCDEVDDDMLRIFVKDTGIGIPNDLQKRIFLPFERGARRRNDVPGVGLGLSICKDLTEKMGGMIGCESVDGAGSTFWVEFPIVTPSPLRSALPE